MEGIEFLRRRFGISKGQTLEETIGTHLNIYTVVKELDAFKKQEIENSLSDYRPSFEQPEENYKTIEEEVYTYFVDMFGDDVIPLDIIAYEKFEDYCKHHKYTRNFVLNAVKNKGKSKPF